MSKTTEGISPRLWLAGMAMQALIHKDKNFADDFWGEDFFQRNWVLDVMCSDAVEIADMLLCIERGE